MVTRNKVSVDSAELVQHDIPLIAPLNLGKLHLSHREILEVRLRNNHYVGRGEAAPLPNYSSEAFEEVYQELQEFLLALPVSATCHHEDLRPLLCRLQSPSSQFAVEQAVVDLFRQQNKLSYFQAWSSYLDLPASDSNPSIRISGLAPDLNFEQMTGSRTIKIKIGPGDLDAATRFCHAANERGLAVRIDANQRLSSSEAKAYAALSVSAFEEPVPTQQLQSLANENIPVFLDESLRQPDADALLSLPCVTGLVLKPMTLGGIGQCFNWLRKAKKHKLSCIVTHCFDGGLSHRATLAFAAHLSQVEHGLATNSCLDAWFAYHGYALPTVTDHTSMEEWEGLTHA
ncbi:MAG: enolase C-terminal domain-like protein [Myxococcota bacterium]|nr:enolase C-terminal domain-like protein [Myxococcota bacterium]